MTKPVISPAQALLILIDYHKVDLVKTALLKTLYLSGSKNTDGQDIKTHLINHPALADYQVSYDVSTINNDPTRRYFETHLAYETILSNLHKIDKDDLEMHFYQLSDQLPADIRNDFEDALNGFVCEDDDHLSKEYASYIAKLTTGTLLPTLDQTARKKIILLVQCSFLAVLNTLFIPLPLNIYSTGLYSAENKGKVFKDEQKTTKNQHLGLMKGHMPIPHDDIAHSPTVLPFWKPSDHCTYDEDAIWVKANFAKMVHPFSNSISGTMLAQLRTHIKFRNEGETFFTKSLGKFSLYTQLSLSTMLYYSGGHSLYEFIFPLSLNAVQQEFSFMQGFNDINLESMFLIDNQVAFTKALNAAIDYNKVILLRAKLHAALQMRFTPESAAMEAEAVIDAVPAITPNATPAIVTNTGPAALGTLVAATSGHKRNSFFSTTDDNTMDNGTEGNSKREEGDEKRARRTIAA